MAGVEKHHDLVRQLEKDSLHNIVLLKCLAAFPNNVRAHQVVDGERVATLLLLNAAVSPSFPFAITINRRRSGKN